MDHSTHNRLVSFIWSIADTCLRDVFVRGKYRDVILPMLVLRRLDSLLEPTKEAVFIRDNGVDGYTGKEIDYSAATIDHVIPKDRGGSDTYDNVVLTTKEINNRKGNKLNSEAGLTLVINPHHPKPLKAYHTIRNVRHQDWRNFLVQSR